MILRSITKHVRDQNWFAVALDFIIVVLGVGMALAAGEWLNARAQKADLAVARLAIDEDLAVVYSSALERLAVRQCRIEQVQSIAKKLRNTDEPWAGVHARTAAQSSITGSLDGIIRSPFRLWPSGAWEAAKARGLLNHMEPDQRRALENAFFVTPIAISTQNTIFNKQSQLKALSLAIDLTPSDRLRYYDVLAEVDAASALLESGSEFTVTFMETAFVEIAPATLAAFHDDLREINAEGATGYGECFEPITLPNVDLTPASLEREP